MYVLEWSLMFTYTFLLILDKVIDLDVFFVSS